MPKDQEFFGSFLQKRTLSSAVLLDVLQTVENMPVASALVVESLAYGLLQGSAEHAAWLAARPALPSSPAGALSVTRDGNVLRLVLDRPWALNAIDCAMRDALCEAFDVAVADPELERVELRAKGRAFCVGADLGEFGTTRDPATAHVIRRQSLPARRIVEVAHRLDVHVQGACVGAGLEMAAFAKRLTASRRAWFQLPELRMGLIPGAGGCVSVPRRIGLERATWMILSGRRVGAATALAWGLIDAIVDEPAVDDGGTDANGS